MNEYNQPTSNNKTLLLIIMIVVIVVVLGVIFWLVKKSGPQAGQPGQENGQIINQSIDGFPTVFYSYVGTIKSVGDNKIVITALKSKNYLKQDTEITVLIDEETVFNKTIIPQKTDGIKPGESGQLFQRETIQLSNLKAGDEITVISYDNVKGKTEFLAKKVEKMEK